VIREVGIKARCRKTEREFCRREEEEEDERTSRAKASVRSVSVRYKSLTLKWLLKGNGQTWQD
jgi:hypothetical protein